MLIIKEYSTKEGYIFDERDELENEYEVNAKSFVFDDCHKIYIVEDEDDIEDIKKTWGENETFYDIKELPKVWNDSCPLRFISNWKLTKQFVRQCYDAEFEFVD